MDLRIGRSVENGGLTAKEQRIEALESGSANVERIHQSIEKNAHDVFDHLSETDQPLAKNYLAKEAFKLGGENAEVNSITITKFDTFYCAVNRFLSVEFSIDDIAAATPSVDKTFQSTEGLAYAEAVKINNGIARIDRELQEHIGDSLTKHPLEEQALIKDYLVNEIYRLGGENAVIHSVVRDDYGRFSANVDTYFYAVCDASYYRPKAPVVEEVSLNPFLNSFMQEAATSMVEARPLNNIDSPFTSHLDGSPPEQLEKENFIDDAFKKYLGNAQAQLTLLNDIRNQAGYFDDTPLSKQEALAERAHFLSIERNELYDLSDRPLDEQYEYFKKRDAFEVSRIELEAKMDDPASRIIIEKEVVTPEYSVSEKAEQWMKDSINKAFVELFTYSDTLVQTSSDAILSAAGYVYDVAKTGELTLSPQPSPDNPFRGYEKSAYVQESGYGKVAEVNLIALGLVGGVFALRQVGLSFQKARTVSLAVQGAGASVGAVANTVGQFTTDEPFDYKSTLIAGVTGWHAPAYGLMGNLAIAGAGSAIDSARQDKPYEEIMTNLGNNVIATAFGYGVAKNFSASVNKVSEDMLKTTNSGRNNVALSIASNIVGTFFSEFVGSKLKKENRERDE